MCFRVSTNGKYKRKQIATENIPIYKALSRCGHVFTGRYQSLFNYFDDRTKKNEILIHNDLRKSDYFNTIEIGLHSCSTIDRAKFHADNNYIVLGYIPIGAEYYYNPVMEEYVSNKLVIYTAKEKRFKNNKILKCVSL